MLGLASLLPLTSGCVAAAIPLAAGAALAGAQTSRPRDRPAAPAAVAATLPSASDRGDLRVVKTALTALPSPDREPAGESAARAFASYALGVAEMRPGAGKRASAVLTAASALRPIRADCGALPSAVFLDLDPGRGTFDPLAPGRADPALGGALVSLRERGVRVVWFSRLGENFAGPARAALAQAGLDPQGADALVLMRTIEERKQTRRDELARLYCPIAMLGDERADFDELYLYLRRPEAAAMLDSMIGRGWFLASPFILAPPTAGRTP